MVPLQIGQPVEDGELHALWAKFTKLKGNSFQLSHLRVADMLEREMKGRIKHLKR